MSEHYFTKNPTSKHETRLLRAELSGREFIFETDSGVFSRDGVDPGTRALVGVLPPCDGRALDLGCGWGAAGVPYALANPGARVVMTDINERAASLASENAARNGAVNVEIVCGDGFENVTGEFDLIFSNPPIRAGKERIYSLFSESRARLKPGGRLYIVIRKQQGAPSALKFLRAEFSGADVVERSGGYWVIRADV